MELQFNPNAIASKAIENHFNACISSGIDVCITAADDNSVTLAPWRFGNPLPKEFTLRQRVAGMGACVGGYLKIEHTAKHDLKGKKCFITLGGTMKQPTVKIRLDSAANRGPSKDVALISFDPKYTP